jgi:uncharacterized protein (TIGR02246 family)
MPVLMGAVLLSEGCQLRVPSHEAAVSALSKVDLEEQQAWIARDVEKILSYYADDAAVLEQNAPPITGKENIRASIKAFVNDAAFSIQRFQITKADVSESGDLGYTQSTDTFTTTDPKTGKPTSASENCLTVRKKSADGAWKIVQDMCHSNVPPTAPDK